VEAGLMMNHSIIEIKAGLMLEKYAIFLYFKIKVMIFIHPAHNTVY